MRLKNKVAIVTGAASGIGKATAELFVKEGAKVVFSDLSTKSAKSVEKRFGNKAAFFQCDVSDSKQVKELVDFTIKKFKKLDIMVNNAGIATNGSALNTKDEVWQKTIDVNLGGAFYGLREGAKAIKKSKSKGSIINVASIAGLVGFQDTLAYCASKGGVIQLTRAAAVDLASDHIRVNAIAPGVIKTGMTKDYLADKGFQEMVKSQTPLGYPAEAKEIAQAALYLASDESSYVTGHILAVDGGWVAK